MVRKALAGLGATCICVLFQSLAAQAATGEIVLYASDATTLAGHWTRAADATAAGGQILTTPDAGWANTTTPFAAPANFAEWTFNAPAGTTYRVWLRLRAGANSKYNDSVFVQLSDALDAFNAPLYRIGTTSGLLVNLQSCNGCALSGWGWLNSAYWLTQTATLTFAADGAHTIRVQTREDGVQLDQIVLSAAAFASDGPGPIVNDATIVAQPALPGSTPLTGVASTLPGTIQVEDFDNGGEGLAYHDTSAGNSGSAYRQTDVDIQTATDGAYNVGWVYPGEWLMYSVNVAAAGSYVLEARVASPGPGGTFHVEFNGTNVTGGLTVPNTGSWQSWTTVSKTVALAAGTQGMKLVFDAAGPAGVGNFTWIRLSTATPGSTPTPYSGTFQPIPSTFSAANFDNGGEGIAFHDLTPENTGGAYRATAVDIENSSLGGVNVGWIADGEWLSYCVNAATAGTYLVKIQVASAWTTGRLHVRFGAVDGPIVQVPNTGGWQNWTEVSFTATLAAGPQLMKLIFDAGGFNVAAITATAVQPTSTLNVPAGGDLQAALDAAHPGDTILLEPGATFVGNFVLPVKPGSTMITIRSAAPDSALPPPNARITPAYTSLLPKLKSPNSQAALRTAPSAHHYVLQFLEMLPNPQGYGDILQLGDGSAAQNSLALVPHDLVVDRVYIHGDPVYGQKRGIALNSASTTIRDSYISEIKAPSQDSQAIANWNGPGPYVITNNYLEAASENVIFGGDDPKIQGLIASDITFTRNHLSKQLSWRGQNWNVKNLFELKNAQRVLVDGNLMEYNWLAAQVGYAVLFTPRNQYGSAPWVVVRDVIFTNNIIRHTASGISLLGHDTNYPSQETTNVVIRNNLFYDVSAANWGGSGRFLLINGGVDITVDHNTIIQDGTSAVYGDTNPAIRFTLTNNIMPDNLWGIMGANTSPGNGTIAYYFSNSTILNGIFAGAPASRYPTGNFYPASMADVGFSDLAGGNFKLAASSIYRLAGTDGKDVGVDIGALIAALP